MGKRKKIMFFTHQSNPTFITGAEKLLLLVLQQLSQEDHCILVSPNEGMITWEAAKKGIEVVVLSYPIFYGMSWPGADTYVQVQNLIGSSLAPLENLISQCHPDLIINATCVNVLPPVAAKRLGIPVVWYLMELIHDSPFKNQALSFIYDHSDYILSISRFIYNSVNIGRQDKNGILYPSWINEDLNPISWDHHRQDLRKNLNLTDFNKLVGFVSAALVPEKGFENFVYMALELCRKRTDTHFLIVGKVFHPEFFNHCLDLIRSAGYSDRFHFTEFQAQIQSIYPAIDILVVPSLVDEGFSLTALEGMIFAKPVVAYMSGGLVEVLGSNTDYNNFLVPKGDITGLEFYCRVLLESNTLRAEVGKANQHSAFQAFGIDRFRSTIKGLIDRL